VKLPFKRIAPTLRQPGRVGDHRRNTARELARTDAFGVRKSVEKLASFGHRRRDIGAGPTLATVFREIALL